MTTTNAYPGHVHIIVAAKNDTNGNPRRVSLLFHPEDGLIDARDHGYKGTPRDWPSYTASIGPVPAGEYKGWLKSGQSAREERQEAKSA